MKPLQRWIFTLFILFITQFNFTINLPAQDIHAFSGAETASFGELALNAGASAIWSTDRSSTPGYFSSTGDAIYSGGMNGTGFLVDGYVKYYRGASATVSQFTFPVGQSTNYKPVTIAGTIPDNSIFSAAWFAGDPGTTTDPTDGITHNRSSRSSGVLGVLAQGFWDWETISGTAGGMTITVTIPDVSASTTAANLILVGWDGAKWINLSGSAGTGPYATYWANGNTEGSLLTGSWQAGITALAIGSLSFILPLRLVSFTAMAKGCNAEMFWKTAEEQNTSHFVVQSSVDGISWLNLVTITAQGVGPGKEYNYTVPQNRPQVHYRLLMAEKDGKEQFSSVVMANCNCGLDEVLTLFPNPVSSSNGTVKVFMTTNYLRKVNIMLSNGTGQVVSKRSIILHERTNVTDLFMGGFASGIYVLSVTDERGQRLFSPQTIVKK